MSSPTAKAKDSVLSPLITKLLSDPLSFKAAGLPDSVSVKPSSYITLSSGEHSAKKEEVKQEVKEVKKEEKKVRPKSMAEAVAQYAGKKYGKKGKKVKKVAQKEEVKEVKKEEVKEEEVEKDEDSKSASPISVTISDDDSESDDDFQTADEDTEESDEGSEEEENEDEGEDEKNEKDGDDKTKDKEDHDSSSSSSSSEEEEDTDDMEQLKRDLKADMYDPKKDEVDKEREEAESVRDTPPTSPEDEMVRKNAQQLQQATEQEFYDLEAEPDDRGSNGSTRIYKNWRELKGEQSAVGLLNHGVTCYMNSALQAMAHVPALLHYLVDVHAGKYSETIDARSVTKVVADTVCKMYGINRHGDRKVLFINPKKLIRKLDSINCMMSEFQQEDSHEYLMSLMSRLQEDSTPKGVKLNESIIYDIFGGLLNQTVTCRSCGHISTTQQEFYDLSLGLETKSRRGSNLLTANQMAQLRRKIGSGKTKDDADSTQLADLLQQRIVLAEQDTQHNLHDDTDKRPARYAVENSIRNFFSPEVIRTDKRDKSGYVCENCKKTTAAVKVSTIERAPETLAVHLKRFRFNGTSSMKVKAPVAYPEVLDLSPYTTSMNSPTRYKLVAVILHQGRSVSSGHYVAHCRQSDGSWASYDDEYVNRIKPAAALSDPNAYVLLYSRLTHKSVEVEGEAESSPRKRQRNGSGTKKRSRNKRAKKW